MRKIIALLMLASAALCALTSCSKEERKTKAVVDIRDTIYAAVNLKFNLSHPRSKMRAVNETLLSDYNVYVFNSAGVIVGWDYKEDESPLSLRVSKTERYTVYVVANAGERITIRSLAELLSYEYTSPVSDGVSLPNGAVIMVGKAEDILISDGCEVSIELTRRIAQIVVFADTSQLNDGVHLTFESISVVNAPKKVKLFQQSKISNVSDILSYPLSTADLFSDGAKCYMYENRQGTLKPSNTLQSEKVLSTSDAGYGKCTYIEIRCGYSSVRYEGTISYRFYLGKDALTNFDIEGNTKQIVNISFKGNASVRENSWRVVTTDLSDNSLITFQKSIVYLYPTDNMLLKWGSYITDDEMPTVVSGNPDAVEVRSVTSQGVQIRAKAEADTYIRATLGPNDITCNVNIRYPVITFISDQMFIDYHQQSQLLYYIYSNKSQLPLIIFNKLNDMQNPHVTFPMGVTNPTIYGNRFTEKEEEPTRINAIFMEYPQFPGDTTEVYVGLKADDSTI